jgi:hypothetical protein
MQLVAHLGNRRNEDVDERKEKGTTHLLWTILGVGLKRTQLSSPSFLDKVNVLWRGSFWRPCVCKPSAWSLYLRENSGISPFDSLRSPPFKSQLVHHSRSCFHLIWSYITVKGEAASLNNFPIYQWNVSRSTVVKWFYLIWCRLSNSYLNVSACECSNLVSDVKGITRIEGVWEQRAEENILT